jgi:amphi-Trp domain-containing protein
MKNYKKLLVKSKNRKNSAELADFLHKIADKIAEKKITFIQGEERTEVEIPDNMLFKISAKEHQLKKKGLSTIITFKVKWFQHENAKIPVEVS